MPSPSASPPTQRIVKHWQLAVAVALLTLVANLWAAPSELLRQHTAQNHFALLAESWLHGRLDLGGPPPDYTGNDDFAIFAGKHWVTFPPFPALLITPLVWFAGSAHAVRDGMFFLLLTPIAPLFTFLSLMKLRETKRVQHSAISCAAVALLLPLGTVFWFSSVQGTVWFAAHVVGTGLSALYVFASIDARRPLLAGLFLGLAFATRVPLLFAAPFFLFEALRDYRTVDPLLLARRVGLFFAPLCAVLLVIAFHNNLRFHDPLEFGHRHLDIVWKPRIEKWGLFNFHYLGRNLGVALASMPFWGHGKDGLRISQHGLALWLTSPFLLWLLFPRFRSAAARSSFLALGLSAALVAVPSLLYQNTGRVQFGYRFSNDFIVFLLLMLPIARRRWTPGLTLAAAAAVAINAFGAFTFQRAEYERYYRTGTKADVYFEPD